MGGLVVVHQRVEQEEVVEERIVLCGWVVWCHCVVALRDVVFVSFHHCPWTVVRHYRH